MIGPDTIAAVATAPGRGAVAMVRLSGPDTLDCLRRVVPGLEWPGPARRARLGHLRDPGTEEVVDQVLVTFFPGPASYTGEDAAEIGCHGGVLAPAMVVDALVAAGARVAEPGEFTRRAYLNGKVDLLQVEAIADLVEARSLVGHRTALHQLDRGLSGRIDRLREGLIRLEATLSHHIDFPEEDDAPVPVETIADAADGLVLELEELASTAPEGVLLREGALVVLAGPPNAGKSSLFNALAGEGRALVTEVPGTTRDALEVSVSLGGFPFRLVDTAGLRETDETVERLGIEVAERYLDAADVVLLCLDGSADAEGGAPGRPGHSATVPPDFGRFMERLGRTPVVEVRTKADRVAPSRRGQAHGGEGEGGEGTAPVWVSSESGEGLDVLQRLLPRMVFKGLVRSGSEAPVLTRRRQLDAVRRAGAEVEAFAAALRGGVPPEVASAHLKDATTALESLIGVIGADEVLDRLFRDFCVGK